MTLVYDPRRADVIADPYPVFHRLQAEDPVHWSEVLGGWVLTRYADVKTALNDARLSSDRITPFLRHKAAGEATGLAELGRLIGLWAVFTDPPKHTRLRSLMNTAFTTRAVERLRPRIADIVASLLDRAAPRGTMDVIRDFAYPLPITVIAEMIGGPPEDREPFKAWSDELAQFIGSALGTPDKYERAARSLTAMAEYFRRMIPARRAQPRDDIMSALIAAEERGDVLSEDELVATCILLLFAGHETTTNLLGNAVLAAAEAVTIDGRTIARGDRVFTMINAANRDPAQFPDPDRLDLGRENNRHIAFGYGIHFCIGAPLARLEAQIALPAALRRLGNLRLAGGEPPWLPSLVFRGMTSLPVVFGA